MSLIRFTEDAVQDLEEIYEYIAQDNIAAADKHRETLRQRWQTLQDQPRIGSKRDNIRPDLRSVTEGNYVIYYRLVEEDIQIVRVLHSARDPEKAFAEAEDC